MSAILNEDPQMISQFTPDSHPGLQRIVNRCLEKSPEKRFQDASDLAFAMLAPPYLIAFSPFSNGSYLEPTTTGSKAGYTLYCSCSRPPTVSRWTLDEVQRCKVTKLAYGRGYGQGAEVMPLFRS